MMTGLGALSKRTCEGLETMLLGARELPTLRAGRATLEADSKPLKTTEVGSMPNMVPYDQLL